ncbi:membrane RL1 protein2 [Human betaherpesvirus 5]|uniref:Membrane RL1 protein2 n=1 Tax=Human cytomegalovirus TaxID=10359 RepID=J7EHN0_HCMV|nr:membrane protein RL12 [Human betaherpesvirus 5]AKI15086.1 membrane RL1 protein2 [Human betaherpesvirus 5]AKI23809.1 membrane protein RL12 [Human betaherpesvirus 5]AKI25329.1 membrane protein RL12 [Human betaherpesvirus 5]AKI26171.1 membrane protein RL12 [Human betaherpesvirus 5]
MRTQHRRWNKSSYTQIICMFIIFWILQKSKCNNTTIANTSTPITPTSLISTTQLASTNTFTSSNVTENTSTEAITSSVKSTDVSSISTTPTTTSMTNATVMTISPNGGINSSIQHVTNNTVTLQTTISTNTTIIINTTENSTPFSNCSSPNSTLSTMLQESETLLNAAQGENITIKHNLTITSCYKTAWLRHFNISTHGKYTHSKIKNGRYYNYSLKILHSRTLCESQTHYLKHHYDLCFTCDHNFSLSLYGLNFTHSGKYSFRCYKYDHPSEQNQNFNLQVHPRNDTNGTDVNPWICEEPKHEWKTLAATSRKPTSHKNYTTTSSTDHLYRHNNHSNTSHSRRTTWTLVLICIACILLFFVRRALNKKYHPLRDDISESEFIVRYNPEHED